MENDILIKELENPIKGRTIGGHWVEAVRAVDLAIQIGTAAGIVEPQKLIECLLIDDDDEEFIVGQDLLKSLGIDVNRLLEQLAQPQVDDEVDPYDNREDKRTESPDIAEILEHLEKLVENAIKAGFPVVHRQKVEELVQKHDIWRIDLRNDPPAKVPAYEIRLKQGATPYRCKSRKYSPAQSKFMREFNEKLVELGWVYRNQASRWSCPALPVKKPCSDGFRQTSDYKPLNARTEPIAGVMPNLDTKLHHARHKKHYGLFNFIKGFWQLPLEKSSQEIMSYATDEGIFTPTRVPQGSCDSALHFQATMENCFSELLYKSLLIWIDDLLLFADTIEQYLAVLDKLFGTMAHYGLKFSATKTKLYQQSVTWCGKVISENGITHDPNRVAALSSMPPPTTAGELQQFICASKWMRDSLVDYARTIQPLQKCLDRAQEGKRKTKPIASGISLQMRKNELISFDQVKMLLTNTAMLAHPKDNATFSLFCDASDVGWSAILTQVESWDQAKSVTEQKHELLTCKGGTFTGAQLHWSVTEKEAYPIVSACDDLYYLLLRPDGFKIFCDHRNLIYMFAPDPDLKKHVRGKLLRWALKLSEYRYTIVHIAGEENVWADLVSRWGGMKPVTVTRFKRVTRLQTTLNRQPLLRPLDQDSFIWPTMTEIATVQRSHSRDKPKDGTEDSSGIYRSKGKIWIPPAASDLIQRLFIISHCGLQGHRGEAVMLNHIKRIFTFKDMVHRARRFLRSCLLCHHVKGGGVIPRPWGPLYRAAKRNEAINWDFLFLGESFGTSKYVLIIKDNFSHFCELVPCDSPVSAVAAEAMLWWHSRFGVPTTWISDSARHFKSEVLALLSKAMKAKQDFAVAYSPWLNGSVERINRDVLQVLRAMILEYSISYQDWVYLMPLVQANLNHSPVQSLAGKAPIEVFTGLPCPSPTSTLFVPGYDPINVDTSTNSIDESMRALRISIEKMHQEVTDQREKRTLLNKKRAEGHQMVNFTIGDYVLRSRVDEKKQNKLLVTWMGPYVVTKCNTHSFTVKHLITGKESNVHASRLKFFAESDLEVTEELREHVSAQGVILKVEAIRKHRWNPDMRDFELLISWEGLEPIEDSWEPMKVMHEDIEVLVGFYVGNAKDKELTEHYNWLKA